MHTPQGEKWGGSAYFASDVKNNNNGRKMNVRIKHQENQSLLKIEVVSLNGEESTPEALSRQIASVDQYDVDKMLLDFSEMHEDIELDELFAFTDQARPIVHKLRRVKTAAVLNEKLNITMMIMSVLFNEGVRVAVFKNRDEALAWLFDAAPGAAAV